MSGHPIPQYLESNPASHACHFLASVLIVPTYQSRDLLQYGHIVCCGHRCHNRILKLGFYRGVFNGGCHRDTHPTIMSAIPHCSALPDELYDFIIDYLHDDRIALDCCSRVCRGWLPASRFHTFNYVEISEKNAERFVPLVLAYRLGKYICHITFSWGMPYIGTPEEDSKLIRILPLLTELPNLKSITHSWVDWIDFHEDDQLLFMANISALENLPVTELTIEKSNFGNPECITEIISACTRLHSVVITSTTWNGKRPAERARRPALSALRKLTIQTAPLPILEWLVERVGISSVQHLVLPALMDDDIPMVARYLALFGESLHYLELQLPFITRNKDLDVFGEQATASPLVVF